VDASVFPKIPGYFILAPIFMVSEKAADTILEDAARENELEQRARKAGEKRGLPVAARDSREEVAAAVAGEDVDPELVRRAYTDWLRRE
jgi:choline dehydrogenase-like flavoprotein